VIGARTERCTGGYFTAAGAPAMISLRQMAEGPVNALNDKQFKAAKTSFLTRGPHCFHTLAKKRVLRSSGALRS